MKIVLRWIGLVSCLFVVVSAGNQAWAEERGGEIGFLVGGTYHADDLTGRSSGEVEPTVGIRGGAIFSRHWGWAFDGLFSPIRSDVDSDTITARASFEYLFQPERRNRWFVSFGGGFLDVDPDVGVEQDVATASVGVGRRYRLEGRKVLRWELRGDRTLDEDDFGDDFTQAHLLVGLNWGARDGRGAADSDGDGVSDRRDRCPDTPRGAIVDERGCPSDGDGDGVWDGIDRCPDTPPGQAVGARGCPVETDSDGDGVSDVRDDCPNTPRGVRVDHRGCARDQDGDGVPNGIDRCPRTPAGARVDASGCPLDGDGDGVPDGLDRCPNTPAGTSVNETGCPRAEPIFEDERRTLVLEGVYFELNEADLTPNSLSILDRVAASLRDWPEVEVEVAGHSDSTGTDAYNLSLSQRRAETVRNYLISRGVKATRLTAKGYGESRPIADNTKAAGRERNRRVELIRTD